MTPIADFYVLGGTLPRDARSYAVRKADEDLLEGLRKGQFCYVLTSRQMGKSSLMVRTVTRLRQEGVTCLVIDLTAIGQNLTEDQWYDGLLNRVATDLDLEDQLDDFWQEQGRLGPLQRWMHALRSIVLAHVSGPIVLFVDEIDAVRSLPFSADEFFAAIRECYNRRTEDPEFARLTFCLLGVATPADLIRDTRSTPFNIGKRIALTDFTEAEAAPLAEGLCRHQTGGGEEAAVSTEEAAKRGTESKEAQALLARVLYWTHGHPYLTQRLCQAVVEAGVKSASGVDQICEDLFLAPGAQETDDNLLFVRERLLRAECDPAGLLTLYAQVRAGKRVPNSETDPYISVLRLSGVVRVENGLLCVRNRIYAHVFDRDWIRTNLPGEELRRQKRAFRRGVLGAAAAMGAILFLGIGGFMLTHYQKHLNMYVPLPDGTEMVVDDISYGNKAVYEPGRFRWNDLLGQHSSTVNFPQPNLSLWLSQYNPKTGKTDLLPDASPKVVAIDEHGHQFVASGGESNLFDKAVRVDFANFPRRSKTIHLQITGRLTNNGIMTKDVVISNPTTTLYPLWIPDPLPCEKTDGDLAVTLRSVKWSPQQKTDRHGVDVLGDYRINPVYVCREGGRSTVEWQIEDQELSDATGNVSNTVGAFAGDLCVFEPAWKLRLKLMKRPEAHFKEAETWTLKGVTMPKDGKIVLLTGSGRVNGVTLKPVSIAAAPSVTYTEGAPPTPSGELGRNPIQYRGNIGVSADFSPSRNEIVVTGAQPQIAVRVAGMTEDQKLTVWATDERGRRYNEEGEGTATPINSADNTPYLLRNLPIPQDIRQVDLHFAVQNIKTVEFMVRPPLPGAL